MAQHLYGQNELASNASAQATSCTRVSESTIKINESQVHSPGAVITKKKLHYKTPLHNRKSGPSGFVCTK